MKPKPKPVDEAPLQKIIAQVASSRTSRRLIQKKLKAKMKNPRYFRLLPDIVLKDLDGKESRERDGTLTPPYSHKEFIRMRLVDNAYVSDEPKDGTKVHWTMAMIQSAHYVLTLISDKEVGDIVALEDEDWQRLKRSTESGTTYNPVGAMACIPFMRAITGASVDKPKDPPKEEPPKEEVTPPAPAELSAAPETPV